MLEVRIVVDQYEANVNERGKMPLKDRPVITLVGNNGAMIETKTGKICFDLCEIRRAIDALVKCNV